MNAWASLDGERFATFPAMRETHSALLEREDEGTPELRAAILAFIQRGAATGALLDAEGERRAAQSLLSYWVTQLYRAGVTLRPVLLSPFDPALAPTLRDALCPYVGLEAFHDRHQGAFFGRDRLVQDWAGRLQTQRWLAVLGPSGSGKSSIVRAGLLPALERGAQLAGQAWSAFPPIVPGSHPLLTLARLTCPAGADIAAEADQYRHDSGRLAQVVAERFRGAVVVAVDQFEELFTLCGDDSARRAFVDNLLALTRGAGTPHRVILTMRTDFEAQIVRLPEFQPLFEAAVVRLTPMGAAELRAAIEEPARAIGLKFADGLVDDLVRDVLGEEAALPLLQFTLLKLWERRDHNRLTRQAYNELGGGRQALARAADEFYDALIYEEQVTAKRILLKLVRPGEGLEVTSNRMRREDLYAGAEARDRVDRVLNDFIRAHLLRLTEGDLETDAQVEVAHETLIRNWPLLVGWLEEERAALRQRQRLTAAAEQWERLGQDPAAVWRGQLLEEARRYPDLSAPEAAFVQAGLAAAEAEAEAQAAARAVELKLEDTTRRFSALAAESILAEYTPGDYAVDPQGQALDFSVEVEQAATCQVTLINAGPILAVFAIEVLGLPGDWVTVEPASLNLNEGEQAAATLTFTVPRRPESRAGLHKFVIQITSRDYPGRGTSRSGSLLVQPYYDFVVGDLAPRRQVIRWAAQTGAVTAVIVNRGNSAAAFRLEAADDNRGCHFEIEPPNSAVSQLRQAEVSVPANSTLEVPVRITPSRRRLVALQRLSFDYTVTVTPLNPSGGAPRALLGQVQSAPLFGPGMLATLLVLLLFLGMVVFQPRIQTFQITAGGRPPASVAQITAGESVRLSWQASPFAELRLEPGMGLLAEPDSSVEVTPQQTTAYRLVARNFLSWLAPDWFTAEAVVQALVDPVLPALEVVLQAPYAGQSEVVILRGESLTLGWTVRYATELTLTTDGIAETLPPAAGSRVVTPEHDTVYVFAAHNQFTGPEGIQQRVTVRVLEPTATPQPPAAVERFDITPQTITAGDKVLITWSVTGAAKVSITGINDQLPPSGSFELAPEQFGVVTYMLTAENAAGQIITAARTFVVNPAPPPTPAFSGPPTIQRFTASAADVSAGAAVTLAWEVAGVSRVALAPLAGDFPARGSVQVKPTRTTQYTLVVSNGSVVAVQSLEVTVRTGSP